MAKNTSNYIDLILAKLDIDWIIKVIDVLLSLIFWVVILKKKWLSPLHREDQFHTSVLYFQEQNHSNLESEDSFRFILRLLNSYHYDEFLVFLVH